VIAMPRVISPTFLAIGFNSINLGTHGQH